MADAVEPALPEAAIQTPPETMTCEEFLALAGDDTRAGWADAEATATNPESSMHQATVRFLVTVIQPFVERYGLGTVLFAPFQMKLGEDLSDWQPDLLFVDTDHRDCLGDTHLDGPAQLVVEITSPESRCCDRGDKFYEYEQGGVQEYWLIDPIREQAEFYQRDESGIYQLARVGDDGIFRSKVLEGLWLEVDWLWQSPLPPVLSVLKEWGIV